jgi:hypothetical protein
MAIFAQVGGIDEDRSSWSAKEDKSMLGSQLSAEDIEKLGKSCGLDLKPGNGEPIASMLAAIGQSVYRNASALKQDTPLSVYFDAR